MKKRMKRSARILALALMLAMVFSVLAVPGGFLVSALEAGLSSVFPLGGAVDSTEIPRVEHNPYDVNISVGELYPVVSTRMIDSWYWKDRIAGYETFPVGQYENSPYYTYSIAPWFTFQMAADSEDSVSGSLPYREGREGVLHGGLSFEEGFTRIYPVQDHNTFGSGQNFREVLDTAVLKRYGLNVDQLSLVSRAHLLSGWFTIGAVTNVDGNRKSYSGYANLRPGDEATYVSASLPLSEASRYTELWYDLRNLYTDALMEAPAFFLVDDTLPSVIDMNLGREEREDHTADLVLTVTFNEAVRFINDKVNALDDLWIDLELYDLEAKKPTTARLYLEKQTDKNVLVYRADIGEYNYRNFEVRRVKDASFGLANFTYVERGAIDLADQMYVSAYKTENYNNRILQVKENDRVYHHMTLMCDVAGNPIDVESIKNWNLKQPRYLSNSFEVTKLEVYNEYTLGRAEGKLSGKANEYEMFAGPANELTLFAYLDTYLTEAEGKNVLAELNVKRADGTPLVARATSVSEYYVDEVYGNVQSGTLLKFEGIRLEAGMTPDVPTGAKNEPIIRVVRFTDEIENKTVYQNPPAPSTTIYADLTAPTSAAKLYGAETIEDENGNVYYTVSIELSGADVMEYARNVGILDTYASVSVGASTDKNTDVRYRFSFAADGALPPESIDGYTETATLPGDGSTVRVGSFKVLNAEAKAYLHLCIPTGGHYLTELKAAFEICDLAGNEYGKIPLSLEYLIDEQAPTVSFGRETLTVTEDNTGMIAGVELLAIDPSGVARLEYFVMGEEHAEWKPIEIDSGKATVSAVWQKTYGGFDEDANRVYEETLLVRAVDTHGNVSLQIEHPLIVSTEKPVPTVVAGDLDAVSALPPLTVSPGLPSLLGERTPLVRVTLSPEGDEYVYMTVIDAAESKVFDFAGRQWYRVRLEGKKMVEVAAGEEIPEEGYTLSEGSVLYPLLSHYGEVHVSLEGGFDDMTPVEGEFLHTAPYAGSYLALPNRYTVRFASPYIESLDVHHVDFGAFYDREGTVVVEDADPGAAPTYLFHAEKRTVNPMRAAQISYTLSNVAWESFGILDLDLAASYAELLYYRNDGESPRTVATQVGFTPTATQYFTIGSYHDDGSLFETGAYFLRVHVKSHSGFEAFFDSGIFVLDAETGESGGLWSYVYHTKASPDALVSDTIYDPDANPQTNVDELHSADDSPITSLGVSVSRRPGEQMRSSVFAIYSYGVDGITLHFETPDSLDTVAGIEVGRVAGYQVWNLYSDPSEEELAQAEFRKNYAFADENGALPNASLALYNGLGKIYTKDTVPKGLEAIGELNLIRGVNTICYRVKMENGYISPIRSFTVNVTDYVPELNIAIENYVPSAEISQQDGMVNAHSVRFFVESAYSLNGEGTVDVQLWSDYGMNVGKTVDGERTNQYLEDPTPQYNGKLGLLTDHLALEDYADFTENSYTSDFPTYNSMCSAIFVAIDEYGGMTFVAPQLGDHERLNVSGGVYGYNHYNVDYYGEYFDDPYLIDDSFITWRIRYRQPTYFGAEILSLTTTLDYQNEPYEVLEIQDTSLRYNLFNIVTNDVSFPLSPSVNETDRGAVVRLSFTNDSGNFHLINPNTTRVILSGDGIDGEVSLPIIDAPNFENPELSLSTENTVGLIGVEYGKERFTVKLANPTADENHAAGEELTRRLRIEGTNLTGQSFSRETEVTLTYRAPTFDAEMTEHGMDLHFNFMTKEHGVLYRTGHFDAIDAVPLTVTDCYGREIPLLWSVTATDDHDTGTDVTVSKVAPTAHEVTVRLQSTAHYRINVTVTDYGLMQVTGNGTSDVTVVLTGSTRFSYTYIDSNGDQQVGYIDVDNIYTPAPRLIWSVDLEEVNEDGERMYRYGDVTVWLVDDNFSLSDRYTGKLPSHTFTPGGATSYAFRANEILATLGDESVTIPEDVTVRLPFELVEIPDPLGSDNPDTEIPNLRIRAYSGVNGVYGEKKLSLILESSNLAGAFPASSDYYTYRYVGNRANAFEVLGEMGWANDYRFAVDVADSSRVRLFLKSGLYNTEIPDFDTGYSDTIEGVTLSSRLLTVKENAQFTLFAVDAKNNVSQVAFDVQNLSEAPVPTTVKLPMGTSVRTYILPPEEADADFEILGAYTVLTDTDPESDYFGKLYLEMKENDRYEIYYRYTYQDTPVEGKLSVNVSEIMLDEICELGREYSANAGEEFTAQSVTATVYLSQRIDSFLMADGGETAPVELSASGNVLTVTYHGNAPALTVTCRSVNGSTHTLHLSEITNIDKTAPSVSEVLREVAANAKSVVLTLSTDDRTTMVGTGVAGERHEADGAVDYRYTVRITENGTYTYRFTNAAGSIGEITVTVSELVKEELTALYSLSPSGTDPVADAALLALEIGDTFYVKPVRHATAAFSHEDSLDLPADKWTAIQVPESLGATQPYITLTDDYGNVLVHQLSQIQVPDTTPPEIVLGRRVWSVREGTDRAVLTAELLSNMTAFDNEGGEIKCEVILPDSMDSIGTYEITYVATDAMGNETRLAARLRVTSIYEPVLVTASGQKVNRDDGVYFASGEEIVFSIDCASIEWRAVLDTGIRTAAQMKDQVDFIYDYNTGNTLSLGVLEAGTYTLCIVTQSRDYFRVLISVE